MAQPLEDQNIMIISTTKHTQRIRASYIRKPTQISRPNDNAMQVSLKFSYSEFSQCDLHKHV